MDSIRINQELNPDQSWLKLLEFFLKIETIIIEAFMNNKFTFFIPSTRSFVTWFFFWDGKYPITNRFVIVTCIGTHILIEICYFRLNKCSKHVFRAAIFLSLSKLFWQRLSLFWQYFWYDNVWFDILKIYLGESKRVKALNRKADKFI